MVDFSNYAEPDKLWVVECNGAPRSGKGTITSKLAARIPGAALEETGVDYRAITFCLLEEELITEESDLKAVLAAVEKLSKEEIAAYVAKRHEIIERGDKKELYSNAVGSMVGKVGQHPEVRVAVKHAFKARVQKHTADPTTHILFIDGRDLIKVIKDLPGINTLIRLFIDCQPFVSAVREARRQKIDMNDPKNDQWYRTALQNIRDRQHADESRKLDPVTVDKDAINYWYNVAVEYETAERLSKQQNISFAEAADITVGHNVFRNDGRHGAGAKAVKENRQVYFDTTEIDKETMLSLVERMIEEAFAVSYNTYTEQSDQLFED
jgi:cytidylate kinase